MNPGKKKGTLLSNPSGKSLDAERTHNARRASKKPDGAPLTLRPPRGVGSGKGVEYPSPWKTSRGLRGEGIDVGRFELRRRKRSVSPVLFPETAKAQIEKKLADVRRISRNSPLAFRSCVVSIPLRKRKEKNPPLRRGWGIRLFPPTFLGRTSSANDPSPQSTARDLGTD